MPEAAAILRDLEQTMRENNSPEVVAAVGEADHLAETVVDSSKADADLCWSVIWNKPLYAYTRTTIADDYVTKLREFVVGNQWYQWGDTSRPFLALDGPANRNANFRFTEHAPAGLMEIPIAPKRLYPIQGAAQALRLRAENSDWPFADLVNMPLETVLPTLRQQFGPRWGHITILHLLTDFGLACKPDLHLTRAVKALGLVPGLRETNNVSVEEALEINAAVKSLVAEIDGEVTPKRLRYFDKILMEASKTGLLKSHGAEPVSPNDELPVLRTVDFREAREMRRRGQSPFD